MLGLTAKQFEKASALRKAFDTAEAAKPAKPAPAPAGNEPPSFRQYQGEARQEFGFIDLYASVKRGA